MDECYRINTTGNIKGLNETLRRFYLHPKKGEAYTHACPKAKHHAKNLIRFLTGKY